MTTETEQLSDLIREIVTSYVAHHSELELDAKEVPGAVYWSLRCHADDYGKIAGKDGAHIKALQALVGRFGEAREEFHAIKLLEPAPARRRQVAPTPAAQTYDPRPARDLLCRTLTAIGMGQFVVEAKVEPNRNPKIDALLFVRFDVHTRSADDYRDVTLADGDALAPVAALGALFRARAKRDGIGVQIEVISP